MCYEVVHGHALSPCVPENPLERTSSPEPSFDLAAAVARVSDPYRKTFFDLAPEIRIEIYRNLFKGQLIVIRGKDYIIKGRKKEKVMRYEKDRALGLNMMLVNKTCLVEVKAVALSVAVFDINFTSKLRMGCPKYLRKQAQFGRPELALLRAIQIPEFPHAVEGLVHQLSNMPFLHDVVWVAPKLLNHYDGTNLSPLNPLFRWNGFVAELLSACRENWSPRVAIQQHVKLAAARIKKPARFVLEFTVLFRWHGECVVYGDVLDETVWIVGTWDKVELSTPKRAVPRLFGPSE